MVQDYYKILGVKKNASEREIRQAYRRLARTYHPDVNPGDTQAETKFKEINEAHEVLSDASKRVRYDQFGHNWKQGEYFNQADRYPGGSRYYWNSNAGRSGIRFDFDRNPSGMNSIFEHLFRGGNSDRTASSGWDKPPEVPIEISLEEAYQGVNRIVQLPTTGAQKAKRLEVKIPPGVDTGSRVHIPLTGTEFFLSVTVRSHHRFTRKGDELYVDLQVPVFDAALGSEHEVKTLSGGVMLTIPPESQTGQVFRLRDQGMPKVGQPDIKGSLFVRLSISLPTGLSQREKTLFQELKQLRTESTVSGNWED